MNDDLVKRLRKNVMCGDAVIEEAADRIEKLEAALREIKTLFANEDAWSVPHSIARKALDAE